MILGVIYLSFICLNVLSVYTSEYKPLFFSVYQIYELFAIIYNSYEPEAKSFSTTSEKLLSLRRRSV